MAGYDEKLDKVLGIKDVMSQDGKGGFEVRRVSYNGGEPKFQFQPFYIKDGQKSFVKFSRIKESMWDAVNEAVQELKTSKMEEQNSSLSKEDIEDVPF